MDDEKRHLLWVLMVANSYSGTASINSPEVQDESSILEVRFRDHRAKIIPWLESIRPLKGLRVLEIGCGNGTSTVALAEPGAIVTAIDIREGLLRDAEGHCRIFGICGNFHLMNATEVATKFAEEKFDIILFYAVLCFHFRTICWVCRMT